MPNDAPGLCGQKAWRLLLGGAREAKTRTVGLGGQRWAMGTSCWALNKLGANASARRSVSCVISSWTGEGLPLGTGVTLVCSELQSVSEFGCRA